jgi:hypothetical protein
MIRDRQAPIKIIEIEKVVVVVEPVDTVDK